MFTIIIPKREFYNEDANEFIYVDGATLKLEHSLYSIASWESKWKKPFLDDKEKTIEETRDYIRCMTLNIENIDDSIYECLTNDDISKIQEYIDDSQTATWFSKQSGSPPSREIITAEVIYYWMIAQNVPFECQYWHISRLITLLRVCNIKNAPKQKIPKKQTASQYRSLNAMRRRQLGSMG